MASSAFLAPEVLGKRVVSLGIKSRMLSFAPASARRNAMVTIWAPASWTAASIKFTEYFPEPKMKREVNSCPPNDKVSFVFMIRLLFYKINK